MSNATILRLVYHLLVVGLVRRVSDISDFGLVTFRAKFHFHSTMYCSFSFYKSYEELEMWMWIWSCNVKLSCIHIIYLIVVMGLGGVLRQGYIMILAYKI